MGRKIRQDALKAMPSLEACLVQRDTLEAILDSVSDGIFTVDDHMRITTFNRAAERITGFSKDEAMRRPCLEVFQQILFEKECLVCRALEKEDYVEEEEREIVTKDGSRRLVLVTIAPLLEAGRRTGIVVVFHDIQALQDLKEKLKGRYRFHNLIGKNHKMQQVYRLIEQVAESNASVLIEGESGTGKELVAHAIHYESPRANGPFVTVNCSALAETLLESELFGHVKGAFTGATYNKVGRFELADGGTIFLDEIGDVSPLIQLKLLRVLQEKVFERVGESKPRKVDVRVIAATNKNLKKLVEEGRFRDDLYYRLNVVRISLPPLRERKDDIPLLVEHFVQKFDQELGRRILGPTKEAMAALLAYGWPGNVRELENAIEHAFVCCRGRRFTLDDLPEEIRGKEAQAGKRRPSSLKQEKEAIVQALREAGGNRSQAARALGINRTTLWRKLKQYGLAAPA